MDEEILHIYGSLLTDHTGSISWLDKNSTELPIADRYIFQFCNMITWLKLFFTNKSVIIGAVRREGARIRA